MKSQIRTALSVTVAAFLIFPMLNVVAAQVSDSKTQAMQRYVQSIDKLSAEQKRHLSSGARNAYYDAQMELQRAAVPSAKMQERSTPRITGETRRLREDPFAMRRRFDNDLVPVNDQKLDFALSPTGGYTQHESSTAWCGNSVVVGFEDTGAYLRTRLSHPAGPASFLNAGYSSDGGRSFKGLKFLDPGTDPNAILSGNPSVACSNPSTFFYAAQYQAFTAFGSANPEDISAIAVSISHDGGATWGALKLEVSNDDLRRVSSPWIAVDPSHPANVYVTYVVLDQSDTNLCNDDYTYNLEVIASANGGSTWSKPTVAAHYCRTSRTVPESPRLAVDRNGKIYLADYVFVEADAGGGEVFSGIYVSSSTDHGATFSSPVQAPGSFPFGQVDAAGVGGILSARIQVNAYPSLAVDPVSSSLYLAWVDGSVNLGPDLVYGATASYGYGDVMVERSDDGGSSWTQPVAVSPTPASYTGQGRDQFQPAVAVDRTGSVAVCYYDRRNDPDNLGVDRYCSLSKDRGATWVDYRETSNAWTPSSGDTVGTNPFSSTSFGDYDTTATDFTGANSGFLAGFQIQHHGNADVYEVKVGRHQGHEQEPEDTLP